MNGHFIVKGRASQVLSSHIIDCRTFLSDTFSVRGNDFIRRVKRYAKDQGLRFEWRPTMRTFAYPARFTADRKDGGFVVTFRDLREAITQTDSLEDCRDEAAGALQAAIEGRIMDGLDVPLPSSPKRRERLVAVPVHTALKAALYLTIREQGVTRVELARRLGIDEKEARRMLDPYHATKAERLEQALAVLGCHAELHVA